MQKCFALSALWLWSIALRASAQIRIEAPYSLAKRFTDSRIMGSTATFGAPFYGDRVLGRIVWGESKDGHAHCTDEDYDLPDASNKDSVNGEANNGGGLIDIVMVRRGKCTFTKKVKIASAKGAHAVIIVDNQALTAKDMENIIVADDGNGESIHIPSILITKAEGDRIIDATRRSDVIVELAWDIPQNHVVEMDLWMSSGSRKSQEFLRDFSERRKTLNEVVQFRPHYAVFSLPSNDPKIYNQLCTDETGRFCTEDPDGSGRVTGKDVLEEDVRQLCIHEMHKVSRTSLDDLKAGKGLVEYSREFWDYVEKFPIECPLEGPDETKQFGSVCALRVMTMVGVDIAKVTKCISTSQDNKLENEAKHTAWSPRALRINGWRYSGMLNADLVTRAICSGFLLQPDECKTLLAPRDPKVKYDGGQIPGGGIGFGTVLLMFVIFGALGLGGMLLYKRSLKQTMHTTVREEVMLEVQSQMSSYVKLQELS